MHHNENATHKQAATKDGKRRYKVIFAKYRKGMPVVKVVKEENTFGNYTIYYAVVVSSLLTVVMCAVVSTRNAQCLGKILLTGPVMLVSVTVWNTTTVCEFFGPGRVPNAYYGCCSSCCCYRFQKIPKALLIRNGKLRNLAYTFVTSFPTDLPS